MPRGRGRSCDVAHRLPRIACARVALAHVRARTPNLGSGVFTGTDVPFWGLTMGLKRSDTGITPPALPELNMPIDFR